MNESPEGINYNEMKEELQVLRQKLEDLETKQAALQVGAPPASRRRFSRRLVMASISLAALLVAAGGLLWGQQIQALFVDNQGNVGIGVNPPGAKLDVAGKIKATEADVSGRLKAGMLEVQNPAGTQPWLAVANGNARVEGKLGINTDSNVQLDVAAEARSKWTDQANPWKEPTARGLYVTAHFGPDKNGVEFRETNQGQGIGFGYNTIYATGNWDKQDLNLMPQPNGSVIIRGKKGLDVEGEIKGKPWISGQYSRKGSDPPKKMTRMDRSVCFLTMVNGFGNGEQVWIGNDVKPREDGFSYWLLEGKTGGWNAAASARCIGAPSPGDGRWTNS